MTQEKYIKLFKKFLKNEASLEEVKLLISWLKNNSGFSNWADSEWEAVSPNMDQDLKNKIFASLQKKMHTERFSVQQIIVRIAAAILLMITTGATVYLYTVQTVQQPDMLVVVNKGQKAQIILPDKTAVWLNSDTRLTYGAQFNHKERVVHLEGEAYFEVAKDTKRPFIVKSGDFSVEAVGTHFNVHAYAKGKYLSTTLLDGKVAVRMNSKETILHPNQKAIWCKDSQTLLTEDVKDAANYTLWIQNKLVFDGRTIEEIAYQLERLYNINIVFYSENIKHYRFSGTLNNTSLESILQLLSITSPLVYHFKGNEVILNENKNIKSYYK